MRSQMEFLIAAYVDYYVDVVLLSAAAARLIAVEYVHAIPAMREKFGRLEMELYAAGRS
jgi:hypothetical protein